MLWSCWRGGGEVTGGGGDSGMTIGSREGLRPSAAPRLLCKLSHLERFLEKAGESINEWADLASLDSGP